MNALAVSSAVVSLIQEKVVQYTTPALAAAPLSWSLETAFLRQAQLLWPKQYSWNCATKWLTQIRAGFERHLSVVETDSTEIGDVGAVLCIELKTADRSCRIAIDFSDYTSIDERIAAASDCYFKMQFQKNGYAYSNVVPGGYVANDHSVYRYASTLRTDGSRLGEYLYGRFGLEFGHEIRSNALEVLRRSREVPFRCNAERIRYSRFLEEAAEAKLCLDLPGNGIFCFRLVDYFALGCAVLAPEHSNLLHVPLEEGLHISFCKTDLSDLPQRAFELLNNPDQLAQMRAQAQDYFDRYLHRNQLTAYYLHTLASRA